MYRQTVITSRAGAVSKYCDEYVCVCLSVCPRGYLRNCTLYLYHFLWMLPMASTWASSGRVTKFQGTGQFRGFLPQWQCIVQHSIWNPYKTGWTDRDAVLGHQWAWPEKQRVTWGWRSTKEKGQFFLGKHVLDKPNVCARSWMDQSNSKFIGVLGLSSRGERSTVATQNWTKIWMGTS